MLLRARSGSTSLARGSVVFSFEGQGSQAWTIDLSGWRCEAGAVQSPALRLAMMTNDFEAMLEGRFDLQRGLAAGHVILQGDRYLLHALAEILQPPEPSVAPSTRKDLRP